jgi:Uma2 family endonuclease
VISSLPQPGLTPEEYLAFERAADTKHECFAGEVSAMSGASRAHNLIAGNIFARLNTQLLGRPCESYTGDMRLKVSETGLYTYTDVVVVRGEPEFEDTEVDTLLNPTLIVEVLSRSTATYDRGDKFEQYRALPSLREYLLVAQDRPHVEQYTRQQGDAWLLVEAKGLDATITLAAIDCELRLAEVYDRVRFPAASEGAPPASP